MKKIALVAGFSFAFLAFFTTLQAQAPSAIPYQAVARNSSGNLIANQSISLRFSIHDGSAMGTIVYRETHTAITNALGLFTVNIGQGTPVTGTFAGINWASGSKFMQVELDPAGGTSYTDMGTQQMLSVPYALYANSGGTPPTAGTGISVSGTTIINTAPDQTVTLTGTGATTVTGTYPNFTVNSTDNNTTYTGGTGINVTGTTITNTAPDQTVTLTGTGATTVTGTYPNFTVNSTDNNTTYSGGTGINVTGTTINNTAPDQTVTLTGTGATTVTGIYPNFTVNSTDNNTTYTGGTGINVTGTTINNTAPDQAVSLTGTGATTVTGIYPNFTVNSTDNNTTYTGGTGINVTGTTINNTAPDQAVSLTGTGATTVTGTYPNFTVNSTDNNTTYTGGTGINVTGTTITNTAPDQTVSLTGTGATTVTGTYPNFTVNSTDNNTTYTGGTGISVTGTTITNTAPDQTVTLTGSGGTTITGTYPNFTVASSTTGTNYWTLSGNNLYNNSGTKIGIGTSTPSYPLDVVSTTTNEVANLGSSSTFGTYLYLKNTSTGGSPWHIISTGSANDEGAGNLVFGIEGSLKMMIQGSNGALGIGTDTPANKLDVEGGVAVGASYSGSSAAPSNGAIIQGNVGIGTSAPVNKLDIEGSLAVGASYSGTSTAPSNGAIIQGNVGIGTASPSEKLEVSGKTKTTFLQLTQGANDGYLLQSDASGNADWVSATNAISSALTGSNGLTVSGSTVKLGGHLSEPTIIFTDSNSLEFNGTLGSNSTDQSQTTDNAFLSSSTSGYQSFKTGAGISSGAYLTAITLKTNASGLSDPAATLNIYSGTGTSGTLLSTGAITISGANSLGEVVTYSLTTPLAISPNTTYTFEIVLSVTPTFRWIFLNNSNPYAGGQSSVSNADFYFVTYYATYNPLLYIESGNDRVGIGTRTTINKLDVAGGVAVGSTYAGTSTAPTNGALIEGNVGIGTTSVTQAKLVVNGSQNTNIGGYGYLNVNGNTNTSSGTNSYSIYASNRIAASEFNAFSDLRIKNILGVSDSRADLQTLMGIRITNYKLKDYISKGDQEYKKVIAQQVEEVYPQAVTKITDVVPDIYQLADIHEGYISLANTLKPGDKVKLIFGERTEVVDVISTDAQGFKVNLPDEGKVFVYGRQVDDFRTVDYEALSMLNISATQELVKMLNVQNAEITLLKAANESIQSDIEQIKAALQLKPATTTVQR